MYTVPQPYDNEGKIPTNEGNKTIPEIMDHLMWCSYKSHRDRGETSHELLVKHGIGTEEMGKRYEKEKLRDKIINNLKELTPGKSRFADLFITMVDRNFENVVRLILEEYASDPSGMWYCIGKDNINLIIKYSKL